MTEDDKPVSALPEKFEVFEQQFDGMTEAQIDDAMSSVAKMDSRIAGAPPEIAIGKEKPKRRRSTPAVKPKDMPEPEKKKRLTAADVPGVGGMVEKRWSGLPMWECPKCLATTFKEQDAKVHQCQQVKYADEEGLE